jgi:hypothetical protein
VLEFVDRHLDGVPGFVPDLVEAEWTVCHEPKRSGSLRHWQPVLSR